MTTIVEPSTRIVGDDEAAAPQTTIVQADQLKPGMIVTNLGVIDAISRVGVMVVAAIRGTVWSLATGTGDIATLDVVWHESQSVTVDVL